VNREGPNVRVILSIATVLSGSPAIAASTIAFPVSVPQECVVLAQQQGVPVVIENRYQAAKAKLKLARLSDRDPMVHECRAAVERAKRAAQQQ
jgi:hypothetical protein